MCFVSRTIKIVIAFLFLTLVLRPSSAFAAPFFFNQPPTAAILEHGNRKTKEIALTFDADMTPYMKTEFEEKKVPSWYNEEVIKTLEETQTKATLFLTGMWAEMYPGETKSFAENPLFEIGNHSYSHPSFGGRCYGLGQLQISQYNVEIEKTQHILKDLTGATPTLFRFPGGCYNDFSLETAESDDLTVVGWDVVSDDAFNTNTESIEENILRNAKNGSIIVMHLHGGPNAPETAKAIAYVIPILKTQGFQFVKVSDMLKKPHLVMK